MLKALTVLGEQVVRTTDDEPRDECGELFEPFLTLSFDFLGCLGITSSNDRILEILAEFAPSTKVSRKGETEKREVFCQVVLESNAS